MSNRAEIDGRGNMTKAEAAVEWLRNVNTRPGPGVGEKIDPTKPGPDDGRAQSDAELSNPLPDASTKEVLAALHHWTLHAGENLAKDLIAASNEIKRLAALTQSDAEIVQWQRRRADDDGWASSWYDCRDDEHLTPKEAGKRDRDGVGYHWEYRPLYASPPRADTSAGLIEAAEWHEEQAEEFRIEAEKAGDPSPSPQAVTHLASAYEFRKRAGNRSGK